MKLRDVTLAQWLVFTFQAVTHSAAPSATGSVNSEPSSPMIAPENSTVSLYCDPLFEKAGVQHAVWYKNGHKIGEVTSSRNLVVRVSALGSLHNTQSKSAENRRFPDSSTENDDQTQRVENMPDIGFLVFERVTLADQGRYWCEDQSSGVQNQAVDLRVAHMGTNFTLQPTWQLARRGRLVRMRCTAENWYPQPHITWIMNGQILRNGSLFTIAERGARGSSELLLHEFDPSLSGRYACVARNIAGYKKASTVVLLADGSDEAPAPTADAEGYPQQPISRADRVMQYVVSADSVLWLIAGMLLCALCVFVYICVVVCCIRPRTRHSSRQRQQQQGRLPLELLPHQQQYFLNSDSQFWKRQRNVHPVAPLP